MTSPAMTSQEQELLTRAQMNAAFHMGNFFARKAPPLTPIEEKKP